MKSKFYILILIFNFFNFFEGNCQELKGRSKPKSLNISKIEDGKIPKLEITKLFFKDNDLNNRLDANEKAFIKFDLVNSGDGRARNLKMNRSPSQILDAMRERGYTIKRGGHIDDFLMSI